MSLITIGSDMELFAKTKKGIHTALCGKIGGSKETPLQLEHLPPGFMIQEDNVALEFNIPVCGSKTAFVEAFRIMRKETKEILMSMNLVQSTNSSVSFDTSELTHPNALIFGCEPDYDAWKMTENKKPTSSNINLRTAGGHIHVGSKVDMVQGVRNMDLCLGVPSVILDNTPESITRRELYGKAGAMRPKSYGWEYRTLSNFWMFKDSLVKWVYSATENACNMTEEVSQKEAKRIQTCINTGNTKEAELIIKQYSLLMP